MLSVYAPVLLSQNIVRILSEAERGELSLHTAHLPLEHLHLQTRPVPIPELRQLIQHLLPLISHPLAFRLWLGHCVRCRGLEIRV